jgi:hypothetical protein
MSKHPQLHRAKRLCADLEKILRSFDMNGEELAQFIELTHGLRVALGIERMVPVTLPQADVNKESLKKFHSFLFPWPEVKHER